MADLSTPRASTAHRVGATAADTVRVTHVVFDFNGGGMESLVAEMAARFRGSSVRVSLITLSGRVGRLGSVTRDRFDEFHVMRPSPVVSMLWPLDVARAIRRTRADVVHLHGGSWYKGARAARLAGVPRVVYTEHGREHDDPPLKRWLDRRAARHTDAVVAVSGRLARYMTDNLGIPAAKIVTIHNGVDPSLFSPGPASADLRAALAIPAGATVIGSVGRLEPVKAYERLLDAAALLRNRLPRPFIVVICGDGSERNALGAHADRLGISHLVRLPGWIHEPVQAYRLLDLFVLPSRSEGQSVSLMEAMSCGVPPIVTDVGANAEMLGPTLTRQVVVAESAETLACLIAETLAIAATSPAISVLVRNRVLEHYSLDRMMSQYEQLYRGDCGLQPTAG